MHRKLILKRIREQSRGEERRGEERRGEDSSGEQREGEGKVQERGKVQRRSTILLSLFDIKRYSEFRRSVHFKYF